MKRFLSILFVLVFSIVGLQITSFANDDTIDYFEFVKSDSRMASNGDFTFDVRIELQSDKFIPQSSTITLSANAVIYDTAISSPVIDPSVEYVIGVYRSGIISKRVAMLTGYADGGTYEITITGLDTSKKYFLVIAPIDKEYFTGTGKSLYGSGNVYDVDVIG